MSCTGREWGTSARSAPRVRNSDALYFSMTLTICSLNKRQRNAGSGPRMRMTSEPAERMCHKPVAGHTMLRTRPSDKRTCGRIVAKSVKNSGSISASAVAPQPLTKFCTALDAASAASFHPVKAAMTVGFTSVGSEIQRMWGEFPIRDNAIYNSLQLWSNRVGTTPASSNDIVEPVS